MGGTETQGSGPNNAGAMGVYDPQFNYGGYDTGKTISTAFNQLGAGFQNQPVPNFMTTPAGSPYIPPPSGGQSTTLIPTSDLGGGNNDLMEILQRLLSGVWG